MAPEHTASPALRSLDGSGEARTIVIVRALFLGDLLLSVPAWRALRRRYPRAEITLIGLPWAAALVARLPHLIDRLLPFPGFPGISEVAYAPERTAQFLAAQQAYGYDLALQMHGDGSASNGFTASLGARASLGYARPDDQRLTLALPYQKADHETLRWLHLAGALGAQVDDPRPEFPVMPGDQAQADRLLGGAGPGPLVVLHIGAKDPARRWPAPRFAALGDALREHCGARLAITGTEGERAPAALVRQRMRAPALDLAGRTDLGSFAAVLARADLLVTNDTGASHLAAAVGTPSVVLFGPSRPAEFAPLDRERHRVVDALEYAAAGDDPVMALRRLPVENVLHACIAQLGLRWLLRAAATPPGRRAGGEESLCAG